MKIAAVQMDVRLMDKAANLAAIRAGLDTAAKNAVRLAVFPECTVPGYCFQSKAEAMPYGDTIPGPTTDALVQMSKDTGVHTVVGLLEVEGNDLYNATVLVGPQGIVGSYRKVHLPLLGVDRFTTPGDRPFAVHEVGGVRIGMLVCYDSSFPEASRCLMLAGVDLIALPTNWPLGALKTAQLVPAARALENNLYFVAVNRIGVERGTAFLGLSSIANPSGEVVARAESNEPTILYATIDPALARQKHIVLVPGEYELDRIKDRRPMMYSTLLEKGYRS